MRKQSGCSKNVRTMEWTLIPSHEERAHRRDVKQEAIILDNLVTIVVTPRILGREDKPACAGTTIENFPLDLEPPPESAGQNKLKGEPSRTECSPQVFTKRTGYL